MRCKVTDEVARDPSEVALAAANEEPQTTIIKIAPKYLATDCATHLRKRAAARQRIVGTISLACTRERRKSRLPSRAFIQLALRRGD
jgi:hypothetical protein